jgi:geranylgeranyl diphosphate synthase type I
MRELLAEHSKLGGAPGIHSAIMQNVAEFVLRPGKRIRPLLFLQTCRALDAHLQVEDPDRLRIAAALEFLHAFILIHDDIIDQAEERRGLPCLHRKIERRLINLADRERAGMSLALVAGDILFAMAQRIILETTSDPAFKVTIANLTLDSMIATGAGEWADVVFGTRDVAKVGVAEIESMYYFKTTRYTFELPMLLAAAVTGQTEDVSAELAAIARPIGFAFQIQNDLAEFRAFDPATLSSSRDVTEGKKTVLLRLAFEMLNETDRGLMQLCLACQPPNEASASRLRELVLRSGAVESLTNLMIEKFAESDRLIDASRLDALPRRQLRNMFALIRQTLEKCQ